MNGLSGLFAHIVFTDEVEKLRTSGFGIHTSVHVDH
jgi:hypothetical protein